MEGAEEGEERNGQYKLFFSISGKIEAARLAAKELLNKWSQFPGVPLKGQFANPIVTPLMLSID